MAYISNPYDALYTNLKNKLTVVADEREYTVGDYMLMKAGQATSQDLAVTPISADQRAIVTFVNFVNERLTVKNPPRKDRTIRRFPLRTSMSALLSAVAASVLMISCCIYAVAGIGDSTVPYTADNADVAEVIVDETIDVEK